MGDFQRKGVSYSSRTLSVDYGSNHSWGDSSVRGPLGPWSRTTDHVSGGGWGGGCVCRVVIGIGRKGSPPRTPFLSVTVRVEGQETVEDHLVIVTDTEVLRTPETRLQLSRCPSTDPGVTVGDRVRTQGLSVRYTSGVTVTTQSRRGHAGSCHSYRLGTGHLTSSTPTGFHAQHPPVDPSDTRFPTISHPVRDTGTPHGTGQTRSSGSGRGWTMEVSKR